MVVPESCEEFINVLACCRKNNVPFYVMGNGTNLLVRDKGYRGVMIKTRQLCRIMVEDTSISAEPGSLLKDVAQAALEGCLTGMGCLRNPGVTGRGCCYECRRLRRRNEGYYPVH